MLAGFRSALDENTRMKIISGGQTGIDRAALDAAIEMGADYGGWCPKGGWAEDLRKPPGLLARYPLLRETPSAEPIQRTEWNVRDADRLMILIDVSGIGVSKGTVAARDFALALGKPHSIIDLDAGDALAQAFACAGDDTSASSICIAGPRESEVPGIYAKAWPFFCAVLARLGR
jgi:Circularly permutated YpsA SLOG family